MLGRPGVQYISKSDTYHFSVIDSFERANGQFLEIDERKWQSYNSMYNLHDLHNVISLIAFQLHVGSSIENCMLINQFG